MMTNNLHETIAERHAVSVELVDAIAARVAPIEKGKRGYQWDLAEQAEALQAEGVKKWAEVFGELVDLDPRTCYEYAKTFSSFAYLDKSVKCRIRFSAWQVFARYIDCLGAEEVFTEWWASGAPPRVDVLKATMAARFGKTPTPLTAQRKVTSVYKSLEGLQVDIYNTVPEAAKQELGVAFAAVGRAKKIMEANNGR
jgi:hypothetical protein